MADLRDCQVHRHSISEADHVSAATFGRDGRCCREGGFAVSCVVGYTRNIEIRAVRGLATRECRKCLVRNMDPRRAKTEPVRRFTQILDGLDQDIEIVGQQLAQSASGAVDRFVRFTDES